MRNSAHGATSMSHVHSRCRDKPLTCLLSARPSSQAPGSDAESEPNRYPIRIRTCGGGSDPNPNLRRRNRSESEPGPAEPIRIRTWPGETDPNPNSRKKRIRTPNPDPNPAKHEPSVLYRDLIDTAMHGMTSARPRACHYACQIAAMTSSRLFVAERIEPRHSSSERHPPWQEPSKLCSSIEGSSGKPQT